MKLSFDEIEDGNVFEELTRAYFKLLEKDPDTNISKVHVPSPGEGTDGGTDLLVEFDMNDEIESFRRKWVVQCKFHESAIGPSKINSVNIPTLLHSHNASGYLLICKSRPTSGVTDLFSRLNKNCKDGKQYVCWTGNEFIQRLHTKNELHATYFPEYNSYINSINSKIK